MPIVENVMFGLSSLALLSQIGIALLGLLYIGTKIGIQPCNTWYERICTILSSNTVAFAFVVVLVAMLGSLFFEHVAGWDPCTLCWWQRIFMYPQVFILGVALYLKRKDVFQYTILLSSIGGIIALYHWWLQLSKVLFPAAPTSVCSLSGPSCAFTPTMTFGYITIPMLALTAFCLTIVSFLIHRKIKTEYT